MPEVNFTVELPSGVTKTCYSPSSVVKKFFAPGDTMTAQEFHDQATTALNEASQRVKAKFGFVCTAALSQLESINQWVSEIPSDAEIKIIKVE